MAIIYLRNSELIKENHFDITEEYHLFKEKKLEDKEVFLEAYIGKYNKQKREYKKAVFLSHRSTYKYKAVELADIFDRAHFDVYLDIKDEELQDQVSKNSNIPDDLLESLLEYGIEKSDYFFLIMTDDYEKSKWIPKEINLAKKHYKDIRLFNHNFYNWFSFKYPIYSSIHELKEDFIQINRR